MSVADSSLSSASAATTTLRVRLACRPDFLNKARYVLTTCAAVWGARLEVVGPDEFADLAYGDVSGDGCASVFHDAGFAAALAGLRDLADPSVLDGTAELRPDPRDPIATAFFHLARIEEYLVPAVDSWWRFPAEASSQFAERQLLACPVDDCFDELHRLVSDARAASGEPPLVRSPLFEGRRFAVALTHDVDALRYWFPAQAAAIPYRLLRELGGRDVSEALREPLATLRLVAKRQFGSNDPYWRLGDICELERRHDAGSTFFFLGEHRYALDGRDGRWYHRHLPEAVAHVQERGAEVGLHASTPATLSLGALHGQKEYIERIVGGPIDGVRFHNLLFNVPDSVEHVHRAGFGYDATIGYAASEGFRPGTSWPFPLYSLARDRALDVIEVPLALMDTTFLSRRYQGLASEQVFRAITNVLGRVAESSGAVSILWHNSGFDDLLTGGFGTVYRRLLEWLQEEGGIGVPAGEIVSVFRGRLEAASPPAAVHTARVSR